MPRTLRRLLAVLGALAVLATAAPGGLAQPAPASAAAAGPEFGVQFHGLWSSYTDADRTKFLDMLAASGATEVRIDVSWAMLQPVGRDSYDLRWGVPFIDRVVKMARARGLDPLLTLWLTPAWANGGKGERVLPTDPRDYARAAAWAAARWADDVKAWEVWNEPNEPSYMVGADPVAYTRLLRAAYPAIKAANPNATVVFGGPASNDSRWIERAYAAGAKGYFDAMATHPYQAVADLAPETPDDGTIYHFTHLASVHALMARYGDGHKPIWATEFGWSSHPNVGTERNWERGVTERQQADYLVRALELVRTTMPYVTHMFWYADRDYKAGSVQNSNYGLLRNDWSAKPAYTALKAYLGGPRTVAPTSDAVMGPFVPRSGLTTPTTGVWKRHGQRRR